MKFAETIVGFQEIPDEVTLLFSITNCPLRCKGCHSEYLWEDTGTQLTPDILDEYIAKYPGITCVCFMGGDRDYTEVEEMARYVKSTTSLKVGWYSGRNEIPRNLRTVFFDYIKIGSYIEEKGGLKSPSTNQRIYKLTDGRKEDITPRFWKK